MLGSSIGQFGKEASFNVHDVPIKEISNKFIFTEISWKRDIYLYDKKNKQNLFLF